MDKANRDMEKKVYRKLAEYSGKKMIYKMAEDSKRYES